MDELPLDKGNLYRLFRSLPGPCALIAADPPAFTILDVNDLYAQTSERARDELAGMSLFDAFPLNLEAPENTGADKLRRSLEQAVSSGRTDALDTFRYDIPRPKEDGGGFSERYWSVQNVPVLDEDGEMSFLLHYVDDVTDQVKARQRVQQLADRANEQNRLQDEFLAMLGHELRNPLAPLATVAQLLELQADEPDPARVGWAAEVISRQVGQLTGLVDDLLDVARLSQGRIELERDIEPLAEILTAAVESIEPIADEREQRLYTDVPASAVFVDADSKRLTQIVVNLLHNATKYTPERGEIWLEAKIDGQDLVVTVEDTGCGIDEELLPHVFDVFRQAERSLERAQGGLGLGLTLVRRLVEMHGGTVAASSQGRGQGSRFEVRLPVVHEVQPEDEEQPEPVDQDARRRVLVVDDNRDAAEALGAMLELMGNQVEIAHDGEQALSQAEVFNPHIVLLDIGLPGIDGYEVARRLRKRPETRDTLLVALTGYGRERDRERAHEAGFDHHIVKPAGQARIQDVLAQAG